MNRLIIIGNGFDLAHGLKTSYCNFIENYWSSIKATNHKDKLIHFGTNNDSIKFDKKYKSLKEINEHLGSFTVNNWKSNNYSCGAFLVFENYFFKSINDKHSINNWVDIEMEYYSHLKAIINKQGYYKNGSSVDNIKKLNEGIRNICIKFEEYLCKNVKPKISSCRNDEIIAIFELRKIGEVDMDKFRNEFSHRNRKKFHDRLNIQSDRQMEAVYKTHNLFDNTCILNFNYTDTVSSYSEQLKDTTVLNIHGELKNKHCPILLGFGDESDTFYKQIEDENENEYLRFMKSSYYLSSDNYKKLFDFVDSGIFQIQILGHSCALSDRTLLKSLFENENCLSIKPFYYPYKKANQYSELNNYGDIVKNISRHFSNKIAMREKVVNINSCSPLPQK